MRIITVNLPQKFLDIIETLTGGTGIYPSRSELIRVAVREYLIRENQSLQGFSSLANGLNMHKITPENEKLLMGGVPGEKDVPAEFL